MSQGAEPLEPAEPKASSDLSKRENPMAPIFAFASGSTIFIVIVVAIILAAAFGFYTYKGSAINAHPNDGLDGAPGAEAPSDPAGNTRIPDDPDQPDNQGSIPTHGTR